MWTVMPSTTVKPLQKFFTLGELQTLASSLQRPMVKGRIWAGDERSQGWAVECEDFPSFIESVKSLAERVEFLAFDELNLDEDTVQLVQEDLSRYAEDEGIPNELVSKALSALKGHENELYGVMAYAFLTSGRTLFVRAQTELARFVFHPQKLLSSDGLASVRKLKTLDN